MPATNQTVSTPNGPGVYQGVMYDDGARYALVAHRPGTEINLDHVQRAWAYPGGIWVLAEYPESVVTE